MKAQKRAAVREEPRSEEFVKLPPADLAELLVRVAETDEDFRKGKLIPAEFVIPGLRRAG